MELKVGDNFKCPEGHEAKILWISEDNKVVAVRCSHEHLKKVVKVSDYTGRGRHALRYWHRTSKKREIYAKNMVFLIKI